MYVSKNLSDRRFPMIKLLRLISVLFLTLSLLILILFAYFNYVIPFSHKISNQNWVEQFLTTQLKQPVHIKALATHWVGLQPTISVDDLIISDNQGSKLLEVKRLDLGINLFASLMGRKIVPGRLNIAGTHLILKEGPDGIVDINNIPFLQAQLHSLNSERLYYLLTCFLTKGIKTLKDVDITWYDQKGNVVLPISKLVFNEKSSFFTRDFNAEAVFWKNTPVSMRGKIYGSFLAKHFLFTRMHINLKNIDIKDNLLIPNFTSRFKARSGKLNVDADVNINRGKTIKMAGNIQATDLLIENKNLVENQIKSLNSHFEMMKRLNGWICSFSHLQLIMGNKSLPIHQIEVEEIRKKQTIIKIFRLDNLPIRETSEFILNNKIFAPHFLDMLKILQPQGEMLTFSLEENDTEKKIISIAGYLKDFSVSSWKRFPGVDHLSGKLHFNLNEGVFDFESNSSVLHYQPMFRYDIPIEKLRGHLTWRNDLENNWVIKLKNLSVSTQEGDANGYMNILLPENKQPFIQSKFYFDVFDASHASKYYPVTVMPPGVVKWLDHAIKGGTINNGIFILNGNMKDFPFEKKGGKFLISGSLKHGILHYLKGWPEVNDIKASIKFEGRSMLITSNHASTLGVNMPFVQAAIPNLEKGVLSLKGQLNSSTNQLVHLNKSNNPLSEILQYPQFDNLAIQGKWQLALNLLLPLDKDLPMKTKLHGILNFEKTSLNIGNLPVFDNVDGLVNFFNDSAEAKNISGNLFNNPFQLSINRNINPSFKETNLLMQSMIDVSDLKKLFGLNSKIVNYLHGKSIFKINLNLLKPETGDARTLLTINSNLEGLESSLPSPLNKNANNLLPSSFSLEQDAFNKKLSFNIGNIVSSILSYKNKNGGSEFDRGNILLHMKNPQLPVTPGLKIDGQLESINWPLWKNVLLDTSDNRKKLSSHSINAFCSIINSLNIKLDELQLENFSLRGMHLLASPKDDELAILIDSDMARGGFQIPKAYPNEPLKIKMQFLKLPDEHSFKTDWKPNDIPPMDLSIANFQYKNKSISNIEMKLRQDHQNLLIKQASVNEPAVNISASGVWREVNGQHETKLVGNFESSNLGAILNQWQITDNMVKGQGGARFNFTWSGSPFDLEAKTLSGTMDLNFNQGRITRLGNKANFGMGMGRVLTLFSLQTLQRRLKLDFSDLTEPGFTFDEMKGMFQFKQGNVFTESASIDGPVAKIRINGRIGLTGKDYNLKLIINPNVTSSLPVVATLTAGPIVGAVTWLADKIFSHQVKQMTEIHYNVTGSWENPNLKTLYETTN